MSSFLSQRSLQRCFFSFYLSLVLFRYWQRKMLSLILNSWNLVFQPRLQHCKVEVMLHVCFWRRLWCWFPKFVIDWVIGNPLGYRCQHSAVFQSQFRVRLEGLGFSCSKLCFEMVIPLKWAAGLNFCCFGERILGNRNEVLNGRLFLFCFFFFSLKIPGF